MAHAAPHSLLLVDPDARARAWLSKRLEAYGGFRAAGAACAEQALADTGSTRYDALLIDIALPDMDGRDLCRLLQRRGARCPIVLMGKSDADSDIVLSLDSGAVDYVVKPLQPDVLLARLRAHLRGHARRDDATLPIGRFSFQVGLKRLVDDERRYVHLTGTEAAILKHLYRAPGQYAARDDLRSQVLGYSGAARTHTIETHVYRLRQKLEHDPGVPRVLLTVPGGYRLALDMPGAPAG
jgi:DNA-binding response OmpR family regulator